MTNLTDIQFDLTHEQAESIVVDMLKADANMLWSAYTDGDLEAGLDLDSVCDVLRYYGYEWVPPQDVSGLEIHEGSDNVFLDLGFDEEEAEKLLKQCREGWDTEEDELKVGDVVNCPAFSGWDFSFIRDIRKESVFPYEIVNKNGKIGFASRDDIVKVF